MLMLVRRWMLERYTFGLYVLGSVGMECGSSFPYSISVPWFAQPVISARDS